MELVVDDRVVAISEDYFDIIQIADNMVKEAKCLVLTTDNDLKQATHMWKQARECKKKIESHRKAVTEPYRKKVNDINAKAKDVTTPLEYVENILQEKINAYQKMLEKKQQDLIAHNQAAAALLDVEPDAIIPLVETLRTPGVSAVKKIIRTIKVKDIRQVPEKYLMINEKAIEADLKMGLIVPGIEVIEEEQTTLRSV